MIDETLSPTWDELLVFEEVLVYGRREDIKTNPPTVIIEIYDQDKVCNVYHICKILHCFSYDQKSEFETVYCLLKGTI